MRIQKIPLRTKTSLALAGALILCSVILTVSQYQVVGRTINAEGEAKAMAYGRSLAASLQPFLHSKDRPALTRAVSQAILHPDVKSVTVVDPQGVILADSGRQGIGTHLALHVETMRKALEKSKTDVVWIETRESGRIRFILTPIMTASANGPTASIVQGAMLIGVDLSGQDRLVAANRTHLLRLNGMTFAALLIVVWAAIRVGLIQPLHVLARSIRATPGSPPASDEAPASADEIAALTESFARLSEALQESEAFNRAALDSLPAHLAVLDKDGHLLTLNTAWERFAREEGDVFPCTPGGLVNYLHVCRDSAKGYGDRAAEAVAGIRGVLNGTFPSFRLNYAPPAGQDRRRFVLTVLPLHRQAGGAVLSHLEVTEQEQAHASLLQRLADVERVRVRLETLYTTVPIGLMYVTTDFMVERISQHMAQLFGRTVEDHLKKHLAATMPPERWTRLKPVLEEVVTSRSPHEPFEESLSDPRVSGGMRFFLSHCYPDVDETGTVRGIHIATQEITTEKQAEREREQHLKELKAKNRELDQMAIRDPLTGLYNRRFFDEALTREWQQFQRSGEAFTVIIMDVDAFKAINDDYGHEAGDRALQQVGITLKTTLRESDLVARLGGDEFAALLPRTDTEQARLVTEKLQDIVRTLRLRTAEGEISMSLSLGAATVPGFPPVMSAAELLRVADKRMYDAKRLASARRSDMG